MKRVLTGIASVGILAVTVGVETANAQSYRRYGPARTYTADTRVVAACSAWTQPSDRPVGTGAGAVTW